MDGSKKEYFGRLQEDIEELDQAQLDGESPRTQTYWIFPALLPHPGGVKKKTESESRQAEQQNVQVIRVRPCLFKDTKRFSISF